MNGGAVSPLRLYRGQGAGTRLRTALRWRTAPLDRVAGLLPATGTVLDWGCGHGLVALQAARRSPEVQVVGCEIDGAKVRSATAAAAAAGLSDRVAFEVVDAAARPSGSWDGIVLCDVLYLQAPGDRSDLVAAAAAALAPGGVLVCKEVDRTPRWKWVLCSFQEQISVRILRITRPGTGLGELPDPAEVAAWMGAAGLAVERVPLGWGSHVPHVALLGRRSATAVP